MLSDLIPKTSDELHQAGVILCVSYMIAAYAVWGVLWMLRRPNLAPINYMGKIFDAATFSSSLMALASIFDPKLLLILGDLKGFLIIAGLCGGFYSLHALFRT